MIEQTSGNILEADVEALVNTVNCVGVMGKGIALQFKQAYPDNFDAYAVACRAGEVQPGRMFITRTGNLFNPRYIINFPTKRHWRSKSRLEDIEVGLQALVADVQRLGIRSIAVPPLGCGNGGLDWNDVRPRIEAAFSALPNVRVLLYAPLGAPAPQAMLVADKALKMTRARALLICLIEMYRSQEYSLTRLEIQKLAYFLQAAGEPLRLNYIKHQYGPYAHNLNHILQKMEGRYLRGYGDGSQRAEIRPLPHAGEQAHLFLAQDSDAQAHLVRIQKLIHGFETPYGLELLATAHWIAHHESPHPPTLPSVEEGMRNWNARKAIRYRQAHIAKALERLEEQGWLPAPD